MAIRQESFMEEIPKFAEMNNLSAHEDARVLFATDDWFASAENLTSPSEPVFKTGYFTREGKWMDGWETRRKRTAGHDWCVIKLAMPAVVYGVDIDTAFFTGNYVPRVSLQAALLTDEQIARFPSRRSEQGKAATAEEMAAVRKLGTARWVTIVPMTRLRPGYRELRHTYVPVSDRNVYNVIRLNAYPDGGIARLNVFGHAYPDWSHTGLDELVDLVLATNGGVCIAHSNAHYGHPRNMLNPGRGANMADGWETARRLDRPAILETDERGVLRVPGKEWAIFRLGHRGIILNIEVDTCHFKGNYPDAVCLEGCDVERYKEDQLDTYYNWTPILEPQKLYSDRQHYFGDELILKHAPLTYVKLTMSPDGGISRVRINGLLAFDRFDTWAHGVDSVTEELTGVKVAVKHRVRGMSITEIDMTPKIATNGAREKL